ncbi:RlpA-like double-psi beta-barrel-protein domain-containing protein-containing protein [Xylariales sp. AK1849]|nr:RlpA-like double-psi beta-barrel-protein domain-containing protein-containing protein [Xylariales sp. AK1849]
MQKFFVSLLALGITVRFGSACKPYSTRANGSIKPTTTAPTTFIYSTIASTQPAPVESTLSSAVNEIDVTTSRTSGAAGVTPTTYLIVPAVETLATTEAIVSQLTEAAITTSTPATSPTTSAVVATVAGSDTTSLGSSVSGEATFYGGNLSGGSCSFTTYTLPSGLFGTAFSGSAWDSAAHCGECVKVTGPDGNSITAMIVDQCPECESTHLDLFEDAFLELGTASEGVISISYEFVECGITDSITLQNKVGTSAYWFSMQVVNANVPVSTLEVSVDGGSTWQSTTRQDYNFFENSSGFGTETVSVRITSTDGQTITVDDVSVAASLETSAGSNF